ncbi:MAG: DUF2288 family protein [Deltaproteobacteria bacterium]|nr:DUF2288 family protein [Deltaproteobacteria bacterium]
MERTELQARLEAEVMEVEWDALVPHHARGALVHVAPELPLVKVAMAVSLDFADDVQGWMATGAVMKVTEEMVEGWSEGPLPVPDRAALRADPADARGPPGARLTGPHWRLSRLDGYPWRLVAVLIALTACAEQDRPGGAWRPGDGGVGADAGDADRRRLGCGRCRGANGGVARPGRAPTRCRSTA